MNLDVNFRECHMWEGTFLRHQGSHLAASWQSSKIRRHYVIVPHGRNQKWPKICFFSVKNKNLVLCTKWQLLGRDLAGRVLFLWLSPSAWENHTIAKSSSEAPPGQAMVLCWGWPPLEVWLPHWARGRCAFATASLSARPPPHGSLSLLHGGISNIVGQIFSFFGWLDSAMFLREEGLVSLFWGSTQVLDLVGYLGPGVVRVHPQWILPTSSFWKWCLLVDF